MKKITLPGYRALFWFSMFLAGIAVATAFRIGDLAKQSISDPRFYDPHKLSARRDVNYPFTIEVYGYIYQGKTGDYIDDRVLAFGAYEKDILFFMRDYVQAWNNPDAVFLDVGACEGQHSLFMSRHVKQVHAFEPFPPVADRFRRMIELNEFSNIHLHQVGLGDKDSLVPFHAAQGDNMGGGRFLTTRSQGKDKPTDAFHVVVGDEFLENLKVQSIEIIKIDVEGFEEHVLAGLASTLKRDWRVVVAEVARPPFGSIASLDQYKELFPADYAFLQMEGHSDLGDNCITGNYKLAEIDRLLSSRSNFEMVVAYPMERAKSIRRHRDGRPTAAGK
jgi:FkbM family methyltransferase